MGVLDELKREAEALEARKARENALNKERQARIESKLRPCMASLYKYFEEFKRHLELVNPKIVADYDVRELGPLTGLHQGNYALITENPQRIEKFSFRCVCAKDGVVELKRADRASRVQYEEYLGQHGLKAKIVDVSHGGAVFHVAAAVPASIDVELDFEDAKVVVRTRNLPRLGQNLFRLPPAEITDSLMDELAKAILRKPNRFDIAAESSLTETGKVRLKRKFSSLVRQQQVQQELESKSAKASIAKRFTRGLLGRRSP